MKIIEWEEEAKRLDKNELVGLIDALKKLHGWPVFEREYAGYGTELLKTILTNERERRD